MCMEWNRWQQCRSPTWYLTCVDILPAWVPFCFNFYDLIVLYTKCKTTCPIVQEAGLNSDLWQHIQRSFPGKNHLQPLATTKLCLSLPLLLWWNLDRASEGEDPQVLVNTCNKALPSRWTGFLGLAGILAVTTLVAQFYLTAEQNQTFKVGWSFKDSRVYFPYFIEGIAVVRWALGQLAWNWLVLQATV